MLTAILEALTRTPRRALATAAAATVVAALPATAHGHQRFHIDLAVPVAVDSCPPQSVGCEGHWTTGDRQERVTPDRWETRGDPVAVPVCPPPVRPGLRVRLPF